jgi:uncharacterized DUF497 family protein
VQIAFDPAKDAINLAKHGLSLAMAQQIDWLTGRVRPAKTVGGETRSQWIGVVDGVVYSVIFTPRANGLWIISLRRASRKERREYGP